MTKLIKSISLSNPFNSPAHRPQATPIESDESVIRKFVVGDTDLAANHHLRFEVAAECRELLNAKGKVIASARQEGERWTVSVKRNSGYWGLLHAVLKTEGYVCLDTGEHNGLARYENYSIPAGYRLNQGDARSLWRSWWANLRQGSNQRLQLEILVFARGKWYPVREILTHKGLIIVKTLVSETQLQTEDPMTWLSRTRFPRSPGHNLAQPTESRATTTSDRHSLPPQDAPPLSPDPLHNQPIVPSELSDLCQLPHSRPPTRPPKAQRSPSPIPPNLAEVVQVHKGRLHIQTTIGIVVVEGESLRFRLDS